MGPLIRGILLRMMYGSVGVNLHHPLVGYYENNLIYDDANPSGRAMTLPEMAGATMTEYVFYCPRKIQAPPNGLMRANFRFFQMQLEDVCSAPALQANDCGSSTLGDWGSVNPLCF